MKNSPSPKPPSQKSLPRKLLLVGAGHAHIGLLRQLIDAKNRLNSLNNLQITLVTEQPQTIYSGMLPGWMAGHYSLADISIDAKSLCKRAGVRFIQQKLAKVEADSSSLSTTKNNTFDYDLLSINTGADTDIRWLNNDQEQADISKKVIPIRPIYPFVERWQQIIVDAKGSDQYHLAIVGAGAAAVELVLAAQYRLQQINGNNNNNHQAYLVCGDHLLPSFNQGFRRKVIGQLERHNVKVIYARAQGYSEGQLHTDTETLSMNAVIAATGVTGSAWTDYTDLQTVDDGFIAVNAVQQSVSHSNVFAVGDVATRVDKQMAHSGVHAVFGGAVEADNLLAYLADKPLKRYKPKNRTLYLLSCGDKYAIGSWGKYSAQGRWVWTLKRYIDKRFVKSANR